MRKREREEHQNTLTLSLLTTSMCFVNWGGFRVSALFSFLSWVQEAEKSQDIPPFFTSGSMWKQIFLLLIENKHYLNFNDKSIFTWLDVYHPCIKNEEEEKIMLHDNKASSYTCIILELQSRVAIENSEIISKKIQIVLTIFTNSSTFSILKSSYCHWFSFLIACHPDLM